MPIPPPKLKKCKGAKLSKGTNAPTAGTGGGRKRKRKTIAFENDISSLISKGTKSPKKVYDCSESPSAAPSISLAPSVHPSDEPSLHPSHEPSVIPSMKPSISHMPSVSLMPSLSMIPSSKPSLAFSPWCDGFEAGQSYTDFASDNDKKVSGTYVYEMVYGQNANLNGQVLPDMDKAIQSMLVEKHVWCGEDDLRRKLTASSPTLMANLLFPGFVVAIETETTVRSSPRRLETADGNIDFIDLGGPDGSNSNTCEQLTPDDSQSCGIFQGTYTMYVRGSNGLSEVQMNTLVLSSIRDGMDQNDGTLASQVQNVDKLHYHGAEFEANQGLNTAGAAIMQPIASASLSGVGILLIATGSVITALFVFAATRRKERYRVRRVEEVIEEDEFLFGKSRGIGLDGLDTETDLMSNEPNAHVLGDESSLTSMDQHEFVLYGHGQYKPGNNNLGMRGDSMNVHTCTSATCQICASKGLADPTFVKSLYPATTSRSYSAPNTVEM